MGMKLLRQLGEVLFNVSFYFVVILVISWGEIKRIKTIVGKSKEIEL